MSFAKGGWKLKIPRDENNYSYPHETDKNEMGPRKIRLLKNQLLGESPIRLALPFFGDGGWFRAGHLHVA